MLTDDTLREGLQAPGMAFTLEEKLKIAELLKAANIKRALVSYPPAHESEFIATVNIVKNKYFDQTFALGRTITKDIDLIDATGANIALHFPFKIEDINKIYSAIEYAVKKDKIIEVAVVDIARYDPEKLIKIVDRLAVLGVNIIQLPDTTGKANPKQISTIISKISKIKDIEIEVHCHNDVGAATVNSLTGVYAGAKYIDTTIFGIGERNGIADTATIAAILKSEGYRINVNFENLRRAYSYLKQKIIDKIGVDFFMKNAPVFGENIKYHTAGTHAAYSDIFQGMNFSVNVYTGKSMIKAILNENGINISDDLLATLVRDLKTISVKTGKALTIEQILNFARDVHVSA